MEAMAGGLKVPDWLGLHSEFKASLHYLAKAYTKTEQ
jgi:hypothetical protein